jgi:hypothetical protein
MTITHHLHSATATKRRVKIPGAKPRPICALCGKQYGKRNTRKTSEFVCHGEPDPQYQGNHHLLQTWVDRSAMMLKPGAEQPQHGMPDYYKTRDANYLHGVRVTWETWDGESYYLTACEPFCGNICALSFAQAAYRDGARYKIKKTE